LPRRQVWAQGWWQEARARPSPNFGPRPAGEVITLAVVHCISLPPGEYRGGAVQRLFLNQLNWDAHPYYAGIRGLQVSAHFFIRRSGCVMQFVSCDQRAWHAGASNWRGREKCNDWSIGIELEGLEGDVFEPAQYQGLIRLLRALRQTLPTGRGGGPRACGAGAQGRPGAWLRLDAAQTRLVRHQAAALRGPRIELLNPRGPAADFTGFRVISTRPQTGECTNRAAS
jgi:AmpD protein